MRCRKKSWVFTSLLQGVLTRSTNEMDKHFYSNLSKPVYPKINDETSQNEITRMTRLEVITKSSDSGVPIIRGKLPFILNLY